MPKIRTGGAAAVVLAAVSCAHAQDQVFLPIPLGDEANARLEEAPLEGYSAPLSSDDPLVLAGLPFARSTGQWAWNSHLDDTGEGSRAITVPLGGMRPDFLVTQLNTYWGRVNFRAGVMTFFLTSGEDVSFELIGNVHVRDWYVGGTTNNIDPAIGGVGYTWPASSGGQRRMDYQRWRIDLPEGLGIAGVRIEDLGAYSESRLILGGITLEFTADCNGDGIVDYGQILDGTYADENENGVPDCCEPSYCRGDLNGDDSVGPPDLGILLAVWGTDGGKISGADINEDGTVNAADLGLLVGAWGDCGCN